MHQFEHLDTIEEGLEIAQELRRFKSVSNIQINEEDYVLTFDINREGSRTWDIGLNSDNRDNLLYDYFIDGMFVCHIEVQFDNNDEFNGKILYMTEDEYENIEYYHITEESDKELYTYVRDIALEYHNKKYK